MLPEKSYSTAAPLTPAPTPQTFAAEADRRRLSGIALKAVRKIAIEWKLTNPQSAALLGVSPSTWDRIKRGERDDEALSQDQLTRASAILGLYKGLQLLFADEMSNRWPQLPNRGQIFSGATPVEAMITADDETELNALAELEGATSTRLLAQDRGFESVPSTEFVYGVPHAKFINAAFAYAKPRELNRFNSPGRGAWYAALDTATCLDEVAFHMTDFLSRIGDYNAVVEYAEMFASFAGEFLDLRDHADHVSLHPDKTIGYPAGNALADAVRSRGINGIIYPSVRSVGGTCFAILWPHAVQSVAQGDVYRLTWNGTPSPRRERV
ncbi:hypothetical protein GW17_00061180 [Ensete ventricosum]|nr:hypothetical protein GW17_00061180 [Ensete ventricosum]